MEFINIDEKLCTGCRECAINCPTSAIEGEPGKSQKINPDKCVMCGQCVSKCKAYITPALEGEKAYAEVRKERGIPESVREPLFAAYNICNLDRLKAALANPGKFTIVQSEPAVRLGLAEEFGEPLGTSAAGKLEAALRRIGFDKVYDAGFAADLMVMEESAELAKRLNEGGVLPMLTANCPAWVRFFENNYPDMTAHLSGCKSPQQMLGALSKTYCANLFDVKPENICSVSVTSCTCRGYESSRPEMNASGYRDVDIVITTRELAWLMKDMGIDYASLPDESSDAPMANGSGAGQLFSVAGGVMEAVIRTAGEQMTGHANPDIEVTSVRGEGMGLHISEIKIGERTLRVGVVTILKIVASVLEDIKAGKLQLDFLEVMTCPFGCIAGSGQPKVLMDNDKIQAIIKRRENTYKHDGELPIRKAHENPDIQKLYSDFPKDKNGKLSHKLLHTKYCINK